MKYRECGFTHRHSEIWTPPWLAILIVRFAMLQHYPFLCFPSGIRIVFSFRQVASHRYLSFAAETPSPCFSFDDHVDYHLAPLAVLTAATRTASLWSLSYSRPRPRSFTITQKSRIGQMVDLHWPSRKRRFVLEVIRLSNT